MKINSAATNLMKVLLHRILQSMNLLKEMCPTVVLEAGYEIEWGAFHLKRLKILTLFEVFLTNIGASKFSEVKTENTFCQYGKFVS